MDFLCGRLLPPLALLQALIGPNIPADTAIASSGGVLLKANGRWVVLQPLTVIYCCLSVAVLRAAAPKSERERCYGGPGFLLVTVVAMRPRG